MSNTIKIIGLIVFSLFSCKKETNPLEYTKKINGSFLFKGVIIFEDTNPFEIREYSQNCNFIYINDKTIFSPVLEMAPFDTFRHAYSDKGNKKIVFTYFYDDHIFIEKDTIAFYYQSNIIEFTAYIENSYGLVKRYKLKANM